MTFNIVLALTLLVAAPAAEARKDSFFSDSYMSDSDPFDGFEGFAANRALCDGLISKWLTALQPRLDEEEASLSVNWMGLGESLSKSGCDLENLYLELWRVIDTGGHRPDNFGTQSYFTSYERCNKLEPEHFVYHSARAYDSRTPIASFVHVVEDEYMFRLCPCGRRRHQRVCDCQYDNNFAKAQCSRVMTVNRTSESIMPWCLPASIEDGSEAASNQLIEEVSLKSLLMNCTHVLVAGTMASCTPIQSYDKVLLTFHKLENSSSDTCLPTRDFGITNPIRVESRLFSQSPIQVNYSSSVGDFTAIVGLEPDSSYCVQLEHVDHPYCVREVMVGRVHNKMPRVCSAHMAKPISTAACSILPTNIVTNFSITHDPVFIAVALILAVLVFIIMLCLFCKCCCRRSSKLKNNSDIRFETERAPMIARSAVSSRITGLNNAGKRVFLLHFLRDEEEDVRCQLLREWIQSFAEIVDDIDDEDKDECINEDPEGWVLTRLTSPDVRVVVVASKTVSQLLAETSSSPPSSSCTTSSTGVCSSVSSSRRTLCDSAEGGAESPEEAVRLLDSGFTCSGDPRKELRHFALKHIQGHLAGNYRQLVVASFGKSGSHGENVANLLTPNKGPMLLPHHLSDLQDWVSHGQHQQLLLKSCCSSKVKQKVDDELPSLGIFKSSSAYEDMSNALNAEQAKLAERRLREALGSENREVLQGGYV